MGLDNGMDKLTRIGINFVAKRTGNSEVQEVQTHVR